MAINPMIYPSWPVLPSVGAVSTTRQGGVSDSPYDSLNLGAHVGDDPLKVAENRQRMSAWENLPQEPYWLEQIHGTDVVILNGAAHMPVQADAAYTNRKGEVCAIMTADCLPVLFCSSQGDEVAAAHAGWRGLCHGVIENTVSCFEAAPEEIMVWLGPAIGPDKFEVGAEVREQFMTFDSQAAAAFSAQGDKYLADIYLLARQRLASLGITQIYGGEYCTMTDAERFFSYRREGITGRMASLIWLR